MSSLRSKLRIQASEPDSGFRKLYFSEGEKLLPKELIGDSEEEAAMGQAPCQLSPAAKGVRR